MIHSSWLMSLYVFHAPAVSSLLLLWNRTRGTLKKLFHLISSHKFILSSLFGVSSYSVEITHSQLTANSSTTHSWDTATPRFVVAARLRRAEEGSKHGSTWMMYNFALSRWCCRNLWQRTRKIGRKVPLSLFFIFQLPRGLWIASLNGFSSLFFCLYVWLLFWVNVNFSGRDWRAQTNAPLI